MIGKFNLKPEEIIYVVDNPKKDFYVKNILPIKTIKIERKNAIYINEDYLSNIKEDILIKNLSEILDYV